MQAVAFANNDMAVVAWTFGGKLANCVGFAVYRIDVRAGTETCLPAMATFSGQQATPGRTTADDPVHNCVVVTGSHNLGYTASYNNDENMAIIRGHRAIAEAYAAHCLDVYDHYAWRYWLENDKDKAWHFLATDDSWQDGYFTADNQVKSAELGFWLAATPAAESLPTPDSASTRARPALQAATGGITPAVGPHSVAARHGVAKRAPAHRPSHRTAE